MKIPVFLSYPRPHLIKQEEFINRIKKYLDSRELEPRTLGVTDYNMTAPLTSIRRIMLECNGLLTIAFKRIKIVKGVEKDGYNLSGPSEQKNINNIWLTSPYCQIEPAMAFQIGLPVLVLREKGVKEDGILEKGTLGMYMPEFDIDGDLDDYFSSMEWKQLIKDWELQVQKVYESKGIPPKLY